MNNLETDFIQIWIPSLKEFKSFKRISNYQYRSLVKYCISYDLESLQWRTGFIKCLSRIIQQNYVDDVELELSNLSLVDIYIILLNLRSASIDPRLTLNISEGETDSFKFSIVLDDIETNMLQHSILFEKFEIDFERRIIGGFPKFHVQTLLRESSTEEILFERIFSVLYQFGHSNLCNVENFDDAIKMMEKIPSKISKKVLDYYKDLEKTASQEVVLFQFNSPKTGKTLLKQMFTTDKRFFIDFLKILFEDDLKSLYIMHYKGMKEIGLDASFIDSISPLEYRAIYFKFYKDDVEREAKNNAKNNGDVGNGQSRIGRMQKTF